MAVFKRRFDRLGSRRREKDTREFARQNLRQPLEEPDADLRRMDVAHAVHQAFRLIGDGLRYARIGVPGVRNAEGGGAVDVTVAVDVGNDGVARRLPEDRKIVGEIRNVARFVSRERPGKLEAAFARNVGDDALEVIAHVSSPIQRTNSAMRGRPP